MSTRTQRLSFLLPTILAGATAAAFAGCDGETEPPLPPPDSPIDPENQVTVVSDVRPPPISGGTLLVTTNGARAIAADPDRDRIVIIDLTTNDVLKVIALQPGDEPGRVAEDASGRIHVALRRGGAVVTVDPTTGELLARRDICVAPRGIATFHATDTGEDSLIVACAEGTLVEIGADPGRTFLKKTQIEADLRDVVVTGDGTLANRRVLVSSFRSAAVITIGPDGAVENETKPRGYQNVFSGREFAPAVAWRMIGTDGGATMIHQRSATVPIGISEEEPDGYGGEVFDCGSTIVNGAMSSFDANGQPATPSGRGGLGPMLLPVDVATTRGLPGDQLVAFVSAGSDTVGVGTKAMLEGSDACDDNFLNATVQLVGPEPIAVSFGPPDLDTGALDLVVQVREPSKLVILDANTLAWKGEISLGGDSRADSGHELFHRNPEAPTTIACASCHPEGRDDGRVWQFDEVGARRTQSLEGGVMDTAPFHWDGDQTDLPKLMETVFEHRMGGFPQSKERIGALKSWLQTVPRVGKSAIEDTAAVDRGKALFESSEVGCTLCHSGAKLTNNTNQPIGKAGASMQVPSLVGVRDRAPYMHDGCAPTLQARFDNGACGGTDHGNIANLSESDVDDLVAYMESL